MEHIYSVRCESTEKPENPAGLCGTRWCQRDIFQKRSYLGIPFIAEWFQINNRWHPELEQFPKNRTTVLDAHAKREVISVGIILLYGLLYSVAGVTDELQGSHIDILKVHESVSCCIEDIKYFREKTEKGFDKIFF